MAKVSSGISSSLRTSRLNPSSGAKRSVSTPFGITKNTKYLWCKSEYPTAPWSLIDFPKDFINSPYAGFSDHSVGIEASLLAIARGAKVIEKHFTLDKSDVTIRDHALSLTPEEFKLMVDVGRDMEKIVDLKKE